MSIPQSILNIVPFFSLIGIYCLIISYQQKHQIEHTIKKGKLTEGTVVDMRSMPNKGVAPVVEFKTVNGMYKHYSNTYRTVSSYKVGQKVNLYYFIYKSRQEFALEDDEPGTMPLTLLIAGIILCAISFPMVIIKMKGLL